METKTLISRLRSVARAHDLNSEIIILLTTTARILEEADHEIHTLHHAITDLGRQLETAEHERDEMLKFLAKAQTHFGATFDPDKKPHKPF